MDILNGKSLIFTDIHFGLKQNSTNRLNVCIKVIKNILQKVKSDDIKNIIFAGDLYHERVSVNVNTLNVALKCIRALAKFCNVYLIVGNHDAHYKNSVEINSLNMFNTTENIKIVDSPTEVMINGKHVLLCPWLSSFEKYQKEQFDMLIGHFDISAKYLIKTYIEDNSRNLETDDNIVNSISDGIHLDASTISSEKSDDMIGDFVDIVKKAGTIFSGHIHQHREFVVRCRKFIFVGSPYQQTRADIDNDCGYYVLDESNKYSFVSIDDTPKHVELKMSKIINAGIDNFNFSIVRGNIVHKVYDVDVDRIVDSKVTQKILDFKPFEELIPDYEVSLDYGKDVKMQNESIELIKKSKLEYIKNYIDNIDSDVLKEQEIDAKALFNILEEYYIKTTDEQ